MPAYTYEAVSMTGETITGETTAENEEIVTTMIRADGYFVTKVKKKSQSVHIGGPPQIKIKPLSVFCSQMAALLKAGVPVSQTLSILRDQVEDKNLKEILTDVYGSVHRGKSLSESFKPYETQLPALLPSMIETGESTGSLDECIARAGDSFARLAKINAKVKTASIYPSVVLFVLIVLIIAMLGFVVPQFAQMYEDAGADLPVLTRMLMSMSDFILTRWYVIIAVVAGVMGGSKYVLSLDGPRTLYDAYKLDMPMLGKFIRKIYAARFSRTYSALSLAGVPVTKAISITARTVLNKHIEKSLYEVVEALQQGSRLSSQLEKIAVFPTMLTYVVKIGEESGTMDELLLKTADFFDDEADTAISALISLMEPTLIILLAAVVLPVLLGILMPLFGMFEHLMG